MVDTQGDGFEADRASGILDGVLCIDNVQDAAADPSRMRTQTIHQNRGVHVVSQKLLQPWDQRTMGVA